MFSEATEVNEKGEVAGRWWSESGKSHAFFWTPALGMVDVGVLDGYTSSFVYDLNDNGQLVGYSFRDYPGRAFSWTADKGIVDLGTLGGDFSEATAVNNRGQVVGWSETATGETHAFLWTATGGMIDLGTFAGSSHAVAINESGRVVGDSQTADRLRRAFVWTGMTGMVMLDSTPGTGSLVGDINESGQLVGEFGSSASSWTPTTGFTTFTLGGTYATAVAVNELGQVVGVDRTVPTGTRQAFSWTPVGGIVPLIGLGGRTGVAVDVNDHGQIVGFSSDGFSLSPHAVLWTPEGAVIDLGEGSASQLNNRGEIVGKVGGRAVLWRIPPRRR